MTAAVTLLFDHDGSLLVLLDEFALDKDQIRLAARLDGLHLEGGQNEHADEHQSDGFLD